MRPATAGFSRMLGVERLGARDGRAEVRLPITPEILNELGIVHGGVIVALADEAIGLAAHSTLTGGAVAVTAELHVHFLMPARSGTLVARASIWRSGRRLVVGEAVVEEWPQGTDPDSPATGGDVVSQGGSGDGQVRAEGSSERARHAPEPRVVARADGTWAVITPAVPLP